MAQTNIINTATGKTGYQIPGAANPVGWTSMNPSATSPAKEAYTSSLANPLVSAYNAGGNQPLSTEQIGKAIGSTAAPQTDYLKSYRDYLSKYAGSMGEDTAVTEATTQLNDIQNLQDTKSLESRKAYQDMLHTSGMLKGGAQAGAAELNADNSYQLANLGVAESGAARKLSALTGQQTAKQNYYKNLLDLSKPVEAGENYVDPTTGQIIGSKSKTGITGEYEYAKSQGYTGTFTQYQNEDANRKRSSTKLTADEKKEPMINDVNEAVSQLRQIVKAKNFEGVSIDDYVAMKDYILSTYGYEGVVELDKAMLALGLTVDMNPNNPGLAKPSK